MIPIHDDNPTSMRPPVTVGLVGACVVVFLWEISLGDRELERAIYAYGVIPAVVMGERSLPGAVAAIPPELTVLTSLFLHGGWMHLIGNMLYLWIFGNNVEDAMGHARFVVFYFLCGSTAAFAQIVQDPGSTIPMVGASGAIGGALGAYLMLFPRAHIVVLIPFGLFMHVARIPALLVLGLWFVMQFVYSAMLPPESGGVAYWAHIGGFAAGAAMIVPFKRTGVRLFGRAGKRRSRKLGSGGKRRTRCGPWGRGPKGSWG